MCVLRLNTHHVCCKMRALNAICHLANELSIGLPHWMNE